MGEQDDYASTVRADAEAAAQRSVAAHRAGEFDRADELLDRAQALDPPAHVAPVAPYKFDRQEWESHGGGLREWGPVNLLNYIRRQPEGDRQVFAQYYGATVGLLTVPGQRNPWDRLSLLPPGFFIGKSVLDLGCNAGEMLLAAASISACWGVGLDCDPRAINAANRIAAFRAFGSHVRFYVHDLERDPLDLLVDYMPEPRADVVLLLAVCAHVRNWRGVIRASAGLGDRMVFESNGHEHEQLGQLRELRRVHEEVVEIAGRGSPGIGARRLYLCR